MNQTENRADSQTQLPWYKFIYSIYNLYHTKPSIFTIKFAQSSCIKFPQYQRIGQLEGHKWLCHIELFNVLGVYYTSANCQGHVAIQFILYPTERGFWSSTNLETCVNLILLSEDLNFQIELIFNNTRHLGCKSFCFNAKWTCLAYGYFDDAF